MKLIFTMLKNLFSLGQSHHKPVVIYRGCHLHHNILQHVCDGIAIMKQGFKLGEDELHRPPVVALNKGHVM